MLVGVTSPNSEGFGGGRVKPELRAKRRLRDIRDGSDVDVQVDAGARRVIRPRPRAFPVAERQSVDVADEVIPLYRFLWFDWDPDAPDP